MAIETLPLEQIYKNSTDMFEAVVKASKRAKQILNKRNYEKQILLDNSNAQILFFKFNFKIFSK